MNGFENIPVQEMIKKQADNFRMQEERKKEDAKVSSDIDMKTVPDVRERR